MASLSIWTTLTVPNINSKGGTLMKYRLATAAMLSTAAMVALATAASFPARVHYVGHDKVAAAFVKGGASSRMKD